MSISFSENRPMMTRRQFVKTTAAGTAGLALLGLPSGRTEALQKYPHWGKVVVIRDEAATEGPNISQNAVRSMLDEAIHALTDGGGWRSLFSSYRSGETVAIKVNSVARLMTTHWEVIESIVGGLVAVGVRPNNIIIWDTSAFTMTAPGYVLTNEPRGVRVMGGAQLKDPYDRTRPLDLEGKKACLSRILTDATYLINAPVLKDHWEAGITFALKNHVGSVDNPRKLFHHPPEEGNMLHTVLGRGRPKHACIAAINRAPDIQEKTRLIVGDALFGIYQGGPAGSPQFTYNGLIVGTDPVATDHQARLIIDEQRTKHGKAPTGPLHIEEAIRLGLGAPINEIRVVPVHRKKTK